MAANARGAHAAGAGLVLCGLISQEAGAGAAVLVFPRAGAIGMVALRLCLSAAILWLAIRPRVRGLDRASWMVAARYGITLAAMNTFFYLALERLYLGTAVTFEVLGPLTLSVVAGRRWLGALWATTALAGVVLLGRGHGSGLDAAGVAFALAAAGCWAGYIVMTKRAGEHFRGLEALPIGMAIGALAIAPIALAAAGTVLFEPTVLLAGAAVALLSSVLPYALEMLALRRLPAPTFSILMAMAPAVAALAGLVILGQSLGLAAWAGLGLVIAASVGAVLSA